MPEPGEIVCHLDNHSHILLMGRSKPMKTGADVNRIGCYSGSSYKSLAIEPCCIL